MPEWLIPFHFIRPWWLLGLLLLPWFWWQQQRVLAGSWLQWVDAPLRGVMLSGGAEQQGRPWRCLGMVLLASLALAGPSWKKQPLPTVQGRDALVWVLDLSRSMDVQDQSPSRLQLARFRMRDVMQAHPEWEYGLIGFAAEPFVISPLTRDRGTVIHLLHELTTDLMPVQGSRLSAALNQAGSLLREAGVNHGEVALLTDAHRVTEQDRIAAVALADAGHRVSVWQLGTDKGAPIPLPQGGFVRDGQGRLVLPVPDQAGLQVLASVGKGHWSALGGVLRPEQDMLTERSANQASKAKPDPGLERWQDEGVWLLLPLTLLALWHGYRTPGLLSLLAVLLLLPPPGMASSRDERVAEHAAWSHFQHGDYAQASHDFRDPAWQASSRYRDKKYAAAARGFAAMTGAEAAFNAGNAWAMAGDYPQAITAYNKALQQKPDFQAAKDNLKQVKSLQKKKKQKQPKQEKQTKSPSDKQKKGEKKTDKKQSGGQQQGKNAAAQAKNSADTEQMPKAGKQGEQQPGSGRRGKEKASDSPQQEAGNQEKTQKNRQKLTDKAKPGKEGVSKKRSADDSTAVKQQKEPAESAEDRQQRQWLMRIPSDPGGLLRNKFRYQYQNRQHDRQARESSREPW